jgi:peptidoglycan/LPS O-acetylase OafA/YrhL
LSRAHLAPLTGVRGIAALWVMLLHLVVVMSALFPGSWAQGFRFVASPGFLGVDLFFILSGFVISYNHVETFAGGVGGTAYRRFMSSRFARVYPVHLVILFALVVAVRVMHAPVGTTDPARWSTGQLIESLLLIHAWTGHAAAWNAVSWSISCEWFVYLLFPWFAALTHTRLRQGSARSLWSVIIGLLTLPAIVAIAWPDAPARLLLQVTCLFAAGCVLHELHRRGSKPGIAEGVPGLLTVCLVLGAAYCVHRGWSAYVTVPLIAPIMAGLARGRGALSRFLSTPVMGYAGRLSFSLYMTHYVWLWLAQYLFPLSRWSEASLAARVAMAACYTAPMFLIAAATYHWIEQPARAFVIRIMAVEPRASTA